MIPADLSSEMKLAMLVPSICSEGLVLEEQSLFPSQASSCTASVTLQDGYKKGTNKQLAA